MTNSLTMRSRIVGYAREFVESGEGSYADAAEKLGIGERTLRRYRLGYSKEELKNRGFDATNRFPDVSPQVKKKMKRGGKLTQLRQNLKARNQPEIPDRAPQPPAGEAFELTGAQIRTPNLAPDAVRQVGREETPSLDAAIMRDTPVSVTMYRVRAGEGRPVRWEIGRSSDTEVLDTEEFVIQTDDLLDSIELENILWARILPIVYPDQA